MLCKDLAAIRGTRLAAFAGEIALLTWPADSARAAHLAARQVPRLLLLDADAEPPERWDPLTDWVRLPARECDIEARLITLRLRMGLV